MNFWLKLTIFVILGLVVAGESQSFYRRPHPRSPPLPFDLRSHSDHRAHPAAPREKRSAEWRKKTLDSGRMLDQTSTNPPMAKIRPTDENDRELIIARDSLNPTTGLDRKDTYTEQKDKTLKFDLPYRMPWPRRGARIDSDAITPTSTDPPVILFKRECDPCMPGWGVKSMCNETMNTVCKPCAFGQWAPSQPHYRECMPCTKCSEGEFEESTCVSTRDTKCDRCSNPKARINDDFLKRCDWHELAKNMSPQEFDVEVVDMQSKELDGNVEWVRESDDDPMLVLIPDHLEPEEDDITLDDPEIDLEEPAAVDSPRLPPSVDEDVSKEEAQEWARVVAMRDQARREVSKISKRLEVERKDLDDDEDDDDDEGEDDFSEQGPRRLLLHPIRPLPQMVPAPRMANLGDQEDDVVQPSDQPLENNFPPSYHSYPIDSLLHAGEGQRRKAIVLLALTCAIVLSTIIFVVCYVREYCRRRGAAYNRVLVVNLSPEEREIVRQSATALERMEQPPKKYRSHGPYSSLHDEEDPELGVYVTENPLEAYLNSTDDRAIAKESLVENEVENEPRIHSRSNHA